MQYMAVGYSLFHYLLLVAYEQSIWLKNWDVAMYFAIGFLSTKFIPQKLAYLAQLEDFPYTIIFIIVSAYD